MISQRYADLSFITIYSSEVEEEADQGMGYNQNFDIINQSRIQLNLKSTDIESALGEIVRGDESFENISTERITKRLLENSSDYSPEVMPGVLFYESHTSKVDRQVLFIGTSKEGINVSQTSNQAYIIMVLLSPKDVKVQDHIRMLNKVTKLIRPNKDVESMKNATDPKEIISALMAR